MFRQNKKHLQTNLFALQNSLPETLQKEILKSEEYAFYELIFCNIREEDFSVLYSDTPSRPNSSVNCLVSALILKQKFNWTYQQLFKSIKFDLLTKTALGIYNLGEVPFDESTMYNFQNRLVGYQVETGIALLEQVFDNLTAEQIKQLKLKTDIQRTDSVMASSNIRGYSRTQLLIEVIQRLWRILDQDDTELYKSEFAHYINKTSGQYIYKLNAKDISSELEKISVLYHFCKHNILPKYKDRDIAKIFERVYNENFTEVESKIEVKDSKELNSSCLQSPDDVDATYRQKRGMGYRGQSINIVETASKENPVNLITDISVNPNNIDDAQVLNQRLDKMKAKTPDLNELHADGAYGNPDVDEKCDKHDIELIQTAIRGNMSEVPIEIVELFEGNYQVNCPFQSVVSELSGKRFKCYFNKEICNACPNLSKCPASARKQGMVYSFTHGDYLRNKRLVRVLSLPPEKRKIRANVEATMKEFAYRMPNKKLKVRGACKANLFAFLTGIAINFGRIYRFKSSKPPKLAIKVTKVAVSFWLFVQSRKKLQIILDF